MEVAVPESNRLQQELAPGGRRLLPSPAELVLPLLYSALLCFSLREENPSFCSLPDQVPGLKQTEGGWSVSPALLLPFWAGKDTPSPVQTGAGGGRVDTLGARPETAAEGQESFTRATGLSAQQTPLLHTGSTSPPFKLHLLPLVIF